MRSLTHFRINWTTTEYFKKKFGDSISLNLSGHSDFRLAELLAITGHEGRTLYVKLFTRVLVDINIDPFCFRVESTTP